MDATTQPGIRIGQILLVTAHFEHREDFLNLPPDSKLEEMNIDVTVEVGTNEENTQGMLRLTVGNSKPEYLYHFQVVMVGLFDVDPHAPNMNLTDFLKVAGSTLMYPFVREVVANITARGRFGPVWLKPFNVAAAFGPRAAEKEQPQAPT